MLIFMYNDFQQIVCKNLSKKWPVFKLVNANEPEQTTTYQMVIWLCSALAMQYLLRLRSCPPCRCHSMQTHTRGRGLHAGWGRWPQSTQRSLELYSGHLKQPTEKAAYWLRTIQGYITTCGNNKKVRFVAFLRVWELGSLNLFGLYCTVSGPRQPL